jgi:hypothetical protein
MKQLLNKNWGINISSNDCKKTFSQDLKRISLPEEFGLRVCRGRENKEV